MLLTLRGRLGPRWNITQIPDSLLGTGKRILVWDGTNIKERSTNEGTPLVLVNGVLRTLAAGETLLY